MVKQERAVRTRQILMEAAASQFDRDGYAGASLSQISREAGISPGALTFHFGSKSELAQAVSQEGRSTVEETLARMRTSVASPLRQLVDLTLELTRLIEQDDIVRAMVRLERERPDAQQWSSLWLPTVRDLLHRSHTSGQLLPAAHPEVMTALVSHLVAGAEIVLRCRPAFAAESAASATDLLGEVWQLILPGVLAPDASHR